MEARRVDEDKKKIQSSRQQDKDKSEKESIDHNVTPDREKNGMSSQQLKVDVAVKLREKL